MKVACTVLNGGDVETYHKRQRTMSLPNPARLLGALPKRSWIKRLRRLGLEVLAPLWRHAAGKSEATRSPRWKWSLWASVSSVAALPPGVRASPRPGRRRPSGGQSPSRGADLGSGSV